MFALRCRSLRAAPVHYTTAGPCCSSFRHEVDKFLAPGATTTLTWFYQARKQRGQSAAPLRVP